MPTAVYTKTDALGPRTYREFPNGMTVVSWNRGWSGYHSVRDQAGQIVATYSRLRDAVEHVNSNA